MRVDTSLQREVDRPLTLKEISPKWFERLYGKRERLPFPLTPVWFKWYFELDSPAKCVIGEAHGYSSSYEQTCKECDRLGWSFGKSFFLRSHARLENDVNQFVLHWNTKHSKWFFNDFFKTRGPWKLTIHHIPLFDSIYSWNRFDEAYWKSFLQPAGTC